MPSLQCSAERTESMARKMRLSDANVAKLRPEGDEYTVWDTRIPGFGVRVRPSGYRAFVYHHTREGSSTRHTLGPVTLTRVEEAHRKCLELQVGTGSKKTERAAVTTPPPRFKDFVAGEWWKTCYERYKPSTRKGTDSALESQLLPTFGDLPLDRITPTDVNRWFDHYSATSPGAANYTLNLFRQIMNQAIAHEYIRTNPARGIKRNPRTKLTRFLSREEIRRLHDALDQCVAERPSRRPGADIIRLLLLTGCRRSEILEPELAGGGRRCSRAERHQDGPEARASEHSRARYHHPPAAHCQPICLSVAAGPVKTAVRASLPLAPCQKTGRYRGCAAS